MAATELKMRGSTMNGNNATSIKTDRNSADEKAGEKSRVLGDPVSVEITGVDEMSQRLSGQYFFRNNCHYVIYEENFEGAKKVVKSRLKIKNGLMELNRKCGMDMTIHLEPGIKWPVQYQTPAGIISLDFEGKEIKVTETENTIVAVARYTMGQGDWKQNDCKIEVKIKRMA